MEKFGISGILGQAPVMLVLLFLVGNYSTSHLDRMKGSAHALCVSMCRCVWVCECMSVCARVSMFECIGARVCVGVYR